MKRNDLIKIFVILISIAFIIQMFSWFGREQKEEEKKETLESISGMVIGKVKGYSKELYIEPWNSTYLYLKTIEEMKKNGEIEYINSIGTTGVIILSSKANISSARERISEEIDASFYAEGILTFNITNLTTANGTMKEFSLPPLNVKIDPINPIGEEIAVEISAEFNTLTGDMRITEAVISPLEDLFAGKGRLECNQSNLYKIEGDVEWSKRYINISKYSEKFNISETNIKYLRNDYVLFDKPLNSTELKNLRNKNLSYILLYSLNNISVNATNSSKVSEDLAFLDRILIFPSSSFSAILSEASVGEPSDEKNEVNTINTIIDKINSSLRDDIENIKIYKKCNVIISEAKKPEDIYFVQKQKISTPWYIEVNNVIKSANENWTVNVVFLGRRIGREIIDIERLDIQ